MVVNIGWANHWLRSMDTYTFLWWLTLVSATKQCFEQRGPGLCVKGKAKCSCVGNGQLKSCDFTLNFPKGEILVVIGKCI